MSIRKHSLLGKLFIATLVVGISSHTATSHADSLSEIDQRTYNESQIMTSQLMNSCHTVPYFDFDRLLSGRWTSYIFNNPSHPSLSDPLTKEDLTPGCRRTLNSWLNNWSKKQGAAEYYDCKVEERASPYRASVDCNAKKLWPVILAWFPSLRK